MSVPPTNAASIRHCLGTMNTLTINRTEENIRRVAPVEDESGFVIIEANFSPPDTLLSERIVIVFQEAIRPTGSPDLQGTYTVEKLGPSNECLEKVEGCFDQIILNGDGECELTGVDGDSEFSWRLTREDWI